MSNNNWYGIMKIIEIQHVDFKGNIIWNAKNIKNVLHLEGEKFLLEAAFYGGQNSTVVPTAYYLGLDNRTNVALADTLDEITEEPVGSGYQRAEIQSNGVFTISFQDDRYIANSPIVSFRAVTGGWGPCRNLFLTGNEKLISTAQLPSAIELKSGDVITMRIGMQIRDYTV